MVTVKEFNKKTGADGISFLTERGRESLSIPRSLESSHMMMMGDTGAGKSVLQRRVLMQIAERGETPLCMILRSNTRRNFSILPAVILS
jgi:type IV secretory pathway VirB4 component